ncbi:uncharacterized protein PV07_08418 [Cladophialophora immunda]|uniref:D-arabinitol 2-dehydrogenase [ribulose-forming] n=1 Tax=Cladophialophora immunda TaxID=569365 RepID=A0A0D1ZBV2_9EURO|nr:uncharacterized protein PV07_08418 [Cladophialophora immunda]KIW25221.1 hypothetical protein PV07_08418 [Cladophialophora immunda]
MGELQPATSVPVEDAREMLASRIIPTMTLSSSSNPLTAPCISSTSSLSHTATATERFKVEGGAILTGGAGSLGLVAARALIEHGLSVVCLFDLPGTLKSSEAQVDTLRKDFPHQVYTYAVDVTCPQAVEEAVQQAVATAQSIDILCCFAGIVDCVHSIAASSQQFRKVIDVNLVGSFHCARAVAKHMIEQKRGGSIVLTSSISAHPTNFPQPQLAYNVSKAAVSHMTRNLAAEWAVHGIRVNSISPGYMDTVLNAGDSLKPIRDIWASHCPFGRMGDIEEITGPIILLSSRRAGGYITGADLLVDGGAMCF